MRVEKNEYEVKRIFWTTQRLSLFFLIKPVIRSREQKFVLYSRVQTPERLHLPCSDEVCRVRWPSWYSRLFGMAARSPANRPVCMTPHGWHVVTDQAKLENSLKMKEAVLPGLYELDGPTHVTLAQAGSPSEMTHEERASTNTFFFNMHQRILIWRKVKREQVLVAKIFRLWLYPVELF